MKGLTSLAGPVSRTSLKAVQTAQDCSQTRRCLLTAEKEPGPRGGSGDKYQEANWEEGHHENTDGTPRLVA